MQVQGLHGVQATKSFWEPKTSDCYRLDIWNKDGVWELQLQQQIEDRLCGQKTIDQSVKLVEDVCWDYAKGRSDKDDMGKFLEHL